MATIEIETAIIGAGQAGVPLARALAGAGKPTALIERNHPGGSCVNWGCTPSKAMIASSRLAAQARRASEWGIRIPQVEVDFAAVMDRARSLVEGARGELEKSLASEANLRLVRGHARQGPLLPLFPNRKGLERNGCYRATLRDIEHECDIMCPALRAERP